MRDLVGLVARSHGMQLRDTFGYLSNHHSNNLRESRGAHAIYTMALLRAADVLHVHAERAPGPRGSIQKLTSPYSRREWESHQAIYDVRLDVNEDPEAVCLDVEPSAVHSSSTLFRLRHWQESLQAELDQSWSVLGEVYGRYERLSKLWLSLRRVKSNLHDAAFESKLAFAPYRASFETAQGEYLRLLAQREQGAYPHFLHQEEIKRYLKEHRVTRPVRVSKMGKWLGEVGFQVYVPYSREELTAVNPATPQTGNPFRGVEHDRNLLSEFGLIKELLDGSNAAHPTVLGPKKP